LCLHNFESILSEYRRNQEGRRKGGKKLKSKDFGRMDRLGNLLSIDLYKIK
jgi:hypothetical protein